MEWMLISGPAGVKLGSCLSRNSGILGSRRREKEVASRPRSRDANLERERKEEGEEARDDVPYH